MERGSFRASQTPPLLTLIIFERFCMRASCWGEKVFLGREIAELPVFVISAGVSDASAVEMKGQDK
jgi:hypothetical protein